MLLARATRNPIMASMMEALMEVMGYFIGRIGPSDNPFVLPSRRRLLRHLRARDEKAAVAEIVTSLTRLQDKYLALADRQRAQAASTRDATAAALAAPTAKRVRQVPGGSGRR